MTLNEMALHLAAIAPAGVTLKFSESTGRWFASARIEISDGVILSSICEHRYDPSDAVEGFFAVLVAVQDPDHWLVTDSSDRALRRHWRWNGVCFANIPLPALRGLTCGTS